MKVIAISGHAMHGKDTAAGMIRDRLAADGKRVLVTHYADLLKYICRTFFNWNGEKDEYGRHLLQYVGTDIIRKTDPGFWVRFIGSILTFFGSHWDYILIPDTRFPNEIDELKNRGFDVVHLRVVRPFFDNRLSEAQRKHPSETALDQTIADCYIMNSGDLELLRETADNFVKEELYGIKTE